MFEQDRLFVRLQQRINSEPAVAACFLSGSYGRHQEDAYSDMDLALVFHSEAERHMLWQQRGAFVQSITPYVPSKSFDATHIRPYLHIALYSNGSKVDYRFETKKELQPNPGDKDIRILKDDRGWAAQFQAACAQVPQLLPSIDKDELQALDERFWIMYWDVFRQLLRGDHYKPFPNYLQLLTFTLPALLNVLPVQDPAYKGLLQAAFSGQVEATLSHMRQLMDSYLAARQAIIDRFHLDFSPDSRFETAFLQLINRFSP